MKNIYSFLISFICLTSMQAQYNLEVSTSDYTEIDNGTSITNGLIWEEIEGTLPLGFDFVLGDLTFDTLYLTYDTTEGILFPSLDFSNPLPAICAVIAEYGDRNSGDPEMVGQPGGASDVSYSTAGEVGERVFTLQYKNLGFEEDIWEYNESIDYVNFQVKLYEGTNKIAFHFGPSVILHPETTFYDVTGPAIGMFDGLEVDDSYGYAELYVVDDSYFILGDNENPYLSSQTAEEFNEEVNIFFEGFPTEDTQYTLSQTNLSTIALPNHQAFAILNNPVENILKLSNTNHINKVEIYNTQGRVLSHQDKDFEDIHVEHLIPGMYILKINTSKGIVSKKFIKK